MKSAHKSAITAIDRAGALLVFPIDNKKAPASLWSHFHPRSPMRWEWDDDGDNRVANLWHLRSELSTTRQVVYTKWFRGRATYFSKSLFMALLRSLNPGQSDTGTREGLSSAALAVLRVLEAESPLSTKEVKRMTDLRGRGNEGVYDRALKELWSRLLIVAFGEVDDGAFPSLAIGSSRVLFESLWQEAFEKSEGVAEKEIQKILCATASGELFYKHYLKVKAATAIAPTGRRVSTAAATATNKIPKVVDFKNLK